MIDVTVHLDEEQEALLRRYLALVQPSRPSLTIEELVQTMVDAGVFYGTAALADPNFLHGKNAEELSIEVAQRFFPGREG